MNFPVRTLKAAALAATLMVAPFDSTLAQKTYGFGTMEQGTASYANSAILAKIINDGKDFQVSVQPRGGPEQFFTLIDEGKMDFGISGALDSYFAATGAGSYQGRPLKNLVIAGVMYDSLLGMFVRKDSPYKSLADLKGKSVPTGWQGTPVIGIIMKAMFATEGLNYPDDVRAYSVPTVGRAADDFAAGRVEASFFLMGAGKVSELDSTIGVRWLSVRNTPEAIAAMGKFGPGLGVKRVEPGPARPGIVGPTNLGTLPQLLHTGVHVPDEVVYAMLKTIFDNVAELRKSPAAMRDIELESVARNFPSPIRYHPGAIKFFRDRGMWPPKG